jgi:hypothetical protein
MVKKVCTAVLMTRREADRQILRPNDSQRDENFSFVSFSFPHPVRHRLDHAVDGVGKLLPLLRPPAAATAAVAGKETKSETNSLLAPIKNLISL